MDTRTSRTIYKNGYSIYTDSPLKILLIKINFIGGLLEYQTFPLSFPLRVILSTPLHQRDPEKGGGDSAPGYE